MRRVGTLALVLCSVALAAPVAGAIAIGCGAANDGSGSHGPIVDFDGSVGIGVDAATPRDATFDATEAEAEAAPPASTVADTWLPQVIYLTIPDRFMNGDTTNDASGYPECAGATPTLFHGGDIAGLRQRLPYLRDLGATAVWITPLYLQTPIRSASCGYHGYWADFTDPDLGAMEPKLGTIADATGLVADLHAANMKLILDMVVNHSGRNARIVTQHPSWFHDASTCASLGDPDIYCPLSGLPDFAQENPAVATFLTDVSRGWVSRVMPDGIRMDTAKHVPPSYFATSWMPAVRGVRPDLFTVGEVFDEGPYTDFTPVLDAGFDSTFNFPLRRAFIDTFAKGGSVDLVAQKIQDSFTTFGAARALMQTTLLDNHDTPRFLSEAPTTVLPDDLATRYGLALTALFTVPGIPQIYYGDELGMIGVDPDNRRDMPAWAWDDASRAGAHGAGYLPNVQATYDLTKSLIKIRHDNTALARGNYVELWRQSGQAANTLAFFRADGDSRVVVIVHNDDKPSGALAMSFTNSHITPADHAAWPDGTVLEDLVNIGAPQTVTVSGGKILVSFTKKSAGVYRVKP